LRERAGRLLEPFLKLRDWIGVQIHSSQTAKRIFTPYFCYRHSAESTTIARFLSIVEEVLKREFGVTT
jgi:hypothetical protein